MIWLFRDAQSEVVNALFGDGRPLATITRRLPTCRNLGMIGEMDDVPIDPVEPWTIKGVPIETRERAIAAAQQEELTVGQWLGRRINEWLDHQELRELVQMATDLSPRDGSLLRLARTRVRDRLKTLGAAG